MRRISWMSYGLLLVMLLAGCQSARVGAQTKPAPDPIVTITLLQLNDVYEIAPVSGGASGGLARVATVRKQLLARNPNTLTLMAGDFFSPSALGTAKVDGERLNGKQMVATLNALEVDYVTFGNHEFDLPEDAFKQRLSESKFTYVSSNVTDASGQPFPSVVRQKVVTARSAAGLQAKMGIIAATIDSNQKDYVHYDDFFDALQTAARALRGDVDILVALTHLSLDEDERVAAEIPEIDLILGGHEHENYQRYRGNPLTPITKADANARSVYIHQLHYNTATRTLDIDTEFLPITSAIAEDAAIKDVVDFWVERGYSGFRQEGFDPAATVAQSPIALDGREASVRNASTALTRLIADAMLRDAKGSELAIYNSGSIRIDDVLPPGSITQYDVIRILPFGGVVVTVKMQGDLVKRVLDQGMDNKGAGGFLQTAKVKRQEDGWHIGGSLLKADREYTVAINDFLLTGHERGLEFLTREQAGLSVVQNNSDIRQAVITEMQQAFK